MIVGLLMEPAAITIPALLTLLRYCGVVPFLVRSLPLPALWLPLCQSPILSDQVLLVIPHEEGLMFNIRFTYL